MGILIINTLLRLFALLLFISGIVNFVWYILKEINNNDKQIQYIKQSFKQIKPEDLIKKAK